MLNPNKINISCEFTGINTATWHIHFIFVCKLVTKQTQWARQKIIFIKHVLQVIFLVYCDYFPFVEKLIGNVICLIVKKKHGLGWVTWMPSKV